MSDQTMIERIARVFARHVVTSGHFAVPGDATDEEREAFWPDFVDEARETLIALREPTDAMVEAWRKNATAETTAYRDWHAMIDAALSERANSQR